MTRIHFYQITQDAPLAKLIKYRPTRKRYGQNRLCCVGGYDVLHELVHQQNVAVYHLHVLELVLESGPASKVVDTEDLGLEVERAGQVDHVDSGCSEKRAHFDDGPRLDFFDEVLKNGTV